MRPHPLTSHRSIVTSCAPDSRTPFLEQPLIVTPRRITNEASMVTQSSAPSATSMIAPPGGAVTSVHASAVPELDGSRTSGALDIAGKVMVFPIGRSSGHVVVVSVSVVLVPKSESSISYVVPDESSTRLPRYSLARASNHRGKPALHVPAPLGR